MSDIPSEPVAAQLHAGGEAVQDVLGDSSRAIDNQRPSDKILAAARGLTREAPLAALTIAFMLGWLAARR